MSWDKRAKQAANGRSFETPKRGAAVAKRVDAIKAKHQGPRGTWGWAEPRPLTDEDWDALQVRPITGDRWDRTQADLVVEMARARHELPTKGGDRG